jgi:hypothetical protein
MVATRQAGQVKPMGHVVHLGEQGRPGDALPNAIFLFAQGGVAGARLGMVLQETGEGGVHRTGILGGTLTFFCLLNDNLG